MGIRGIVGKWNALRNAAMTSGNSVYPIIQTVWKKALFLNQHVDEIGTLGPIVHFPSEQSDLERDHH